MVLTAGAADVNAMVLVQAFIDFIYYAQLNFCTAQTLDALPVRKSLDTFYRHQDAFQGPDIREHIDIVKFYAMTHYVDAIIEKRCSDRYNTELSERLHIDSAQAGYRTGNLRDYIIYMNTWLERTSND
jgi:hypothetical protein